MEHLFIFRIPTLVALAVLIVTAGACSAPRIAEDGPTVPEPTERTLDWSEVESFDAQPYADERPASQNSVQHDVPEALLQSRADAGIIQVIDGYRIQVFSSLNRNDAVQAEEGVKAWLRGLSADTKREYGLTELPAVYNNYKQPLYRIRTGDFTRRTDAERLMSLMASQFGTVFVVPDKVTVRR